MPPIMKVLLAIIALLSAGTQWLASSTQVDPYAVLPGAWGWQGTDDCTVSPQKIRFSPDRKQMLLSITPKDEHGTRGPRREVTYQILRELPDGLRMSLDGEKRLDPSGKPVTWDLMLLGDEQFCWHRGDWPGTGCTKSMVRCSKPERQTMAPEEDADRGSDLFSDGHRYLGHAVASSFSRRASA